MTAGPLVLAWYGADLRSGRVAEELRALNPTQPIGRRISAAASANLDLALAGAPAEWEAATEPGATLLVAVDAATGTPLWSGIPLPRSGGSAPTATIGVSTPEGYLDRRYPGTVSVTATDISTVMQQVATPALTQGPPLTVDVTACGTLIDWGVLDSDDKSILSCLTELAALEGAPEFGIDTVWADAAHSAFQLVLRIRPTLGVQSTQPEVTFDLPGCISTYTLTESYEAGKGATSVTARGEAEGSARITGDTYLATDLLADGRCLWEYRYQPAAGITDIDQLNAHAAEALALLERGSRAWTVQAVASKAPRLGTDWALGDSVAVDIATSPRHPHGASIVARVYGWDLDPGADRVTPILLEG